MQHKLWGEANFYALFNRNRAVYLFVVGGGEGRKKPQLPKHFFLDAAAEGLHAPGAGAGPAAAVQTKPCGEREVCRPAALGKTRDGDT